MFKMRKILAMLLATLMILPATACASDGDKDGKNPTSTAGEAETKHEFFPDIEKQVYNGATFCMSGAKEDGSWYLADEYKTGGRCLRCLQERGRRL